MAFWRWLLFVAAALAASSMSLATQSEPPAAEEAQDEHGPKKFTCPVGGEIFEQDVSWFGYPLAARPDGGTLGSEYSDQIIPECPGNGLVMVPKHDGEADDPEAFTPYTPDEIAKLPALIASAEYKAMRQEARFYRLYWLSGKLGRPAIQQLHLLQHIGFINGTPERQKRYLEFFVSETDMLSKDRSLDQSVTLLHNYYAVNALRQLGRFDEARTRIAAIKAAATAMQASRTAPAGNPHFEEDPISYPEDDIMEMSEAQLAAIDLGDTDKHPVSMMSDKVANSICRDLDDSYPPATEATKRGCAKRKVDKAKMDSEIKKSFAYDDDPKALALLCKDAAKADDDGELADACRRKDRMADYDARQAEAARLLKNPRALDVQCKAVVIPGKYASPKTALGEACQKRAEALREEQSTALAAKMRKLPAEFDRLCTMKYPDMSSDDPVELACHSVKSERDDARDNRESARLGKMTEAQIWAECIATNGGRTEDGYSPLRSRCADIEEEKEAAAWKALEADPAKLEAECAKDDTAQADWLSSRCYRRAQDKAEAQAFDMAKDHGKLVAACTDTPMLERGAVLRAACNSYRKCVITRFDEMPYSHVRGQYTMDPPPPAQLVSTCYDSVEQANAAWAAYQKDPKSLRANGCASGKDMWGDEIDAAECAAYARGEDIFADVAAATEVELSEADAEMLAACTAAKLLDFQKLKKESKLIASKRGPSLNEVAAEQCKEERRANIDAAADMAAGAMKKDVK